MTDVAASSAARSAAAGTSGTAPWIFGYGSLMWRPGFPFVARRKAHLAGYQRAFCRYSFRHRGTPERPGLVIGLRAEDAADAATSKGVRGCVGIAFAPDPAHLDETMAYLDEREGAGYHRVLTPLTLLDGPRPETVSAWVYVPNPEHPSYFGQKDPAQIVPLILQGRGESGTAYDYLVSMLGELRKLDVAEPELEAVLAQAEAEAERRRKAGA